MRTTKQRWVVLCQRLGIKDSQATNTAINDTYDKLIAVYTAPDRHYHDLGHISDGLEKIDEIPHSPERDILEMAWWWHDFIYNPGSSTNEKDSWTEADKTLIELGFHISFRVRVGQLIFNTTHDHIPNTIWGQRIVDIDLSSLGAPPKVFDENAVKIQREFNIPDEIFFSTRVRFFTKFLKGRPTIYLTEYFRDKYEAQARENINRVIAQWSD